jgi:hypothetical protein
MPAFVPDFMFPLVDEDVALVLVVVLECVVELIGL